MSDPAPSPALPPPPDPPDLVHKTIEGTLTLTGDVKLYRVQTKRRQPPPRKKTAPPDPGRSTMDRKEEIGHGGMGTIYSVEQRSLARDVALKELHPSLAREEKHRRRFLEEAIITGQLEHPNVPPTYILDPKRCRWTMKRIRGRDLEEILKGEFSQAKVLRILVAVCDALAFAHAKGVIHRDLKPENIMVGDEFGEVYLMDWGIARVVEVPDQPKALEKIRLTNVEPRGSIAGTPFYLSPEQAYGDVTLIDHRSDIYAMGIILYRVMTGTFPIHTDNLVHLLALKCNPQTLIPVPEGNKELAAIAMKALAQDPKDRYPTVEAFKEDLETYLSGGKVSVYDYSRFENLAKWVQQNAVMTMGFLGAGGILLAISLAVAAYAGYSAQRASAEQAEQKKMDAEAAEKQTRKVVLAQQHAQSLLDQISFLERGDGYDSAALEIIKQAYQASPAYWRTYLVEAKLHADQRRSGDAEMKFDKAAEVYRAQFDVDSAEVWFEQGMYFGLPYDLGGRGQEKKALECLDRAASVDGDKLYGRLSRAFALVLRAKDKPEEAEDLLLKAIQQTEDLIREIDSRNVKATWLVRAWALGSSAYASQASPAFKKFANYRDAAEALLRILEVEKGHTGMRSFLATLYRRMGETRKAIAVYTDILKTTKKAYLYDNRGTAYFFSREYAKAEKDYTSAIRFDRGYAKAYFNRGATRKKLKNWDGAIEDFSQALKLKPEQASVHLSRGLTYEITGDRAKALKDYKKAFDLKPSLWLAWRNAGYIELQDKNFRDAEKHLQEASTRAPDSYRPAIKRKLEAARAGR